MLTLVLFLANATFLKLIWLAGVSLASVLTWLPLMSFNKPLLHTLPGGRLNNYLLLLTVIKHFTKHVT